MSSSALLFLLLVASQVASRCELSHTKGVASFAFLSKRSPFRGTQGKKSNNFYVNIREALGAVSSSVWSATAHPRERKKKKS